MKKRNKLLALLLAGSLCSTNAVTAFAADNTSDGNLISSENKASVETPVTETPQTETPKTEAPKTETPQTEAPQTEAPKTEAPKAETPQMEVPQTEAPQMEAPQTEVPVAETTNGWVSMGSYWYYYVNGEKLTECTYFIDGKWWLFGYDGSLTYNHEMYVQKADSQIWDYFRSTSDGSLELGWYSDGTHWFYYDQEDGHRYYAEEFEVDGNLYYVNSDGELLTSDWYINSEGKSYWADSTGVLTEKSTSEWVYADGSWYYYKDGVLLTEGIYEINGTYYHFEYDGRMSVGSFWCYDETLNKSGYKLADENGQVIIWGKDWQRVGDNYYFFEEIGWLAANKFLTISGEEYYFYGDGMMASGHFSMTEDDTKWDYVTSDSGAIHPECKTGGWVQYQNEWYYFKAPYTLAKSEFLDIDGRTFYFYGSGTMAQGNIWINDKIYSTDSNGAIIKNQWFTQRDQWYYAQKDGALYKNGICEINGKKYYFDSNGMLETGLVFFYNGTSAYLTDESGAIITAKGWRKYFSEWYYINSDGKVALSQWIGNHYYVDDRGAMVIGSRIIDDTYYYFDKNGYLVTDTTSGTPGWQFSNGYWYYFDKDGKPYDGWVGSYFIEHGRMLTNSLVYDKNSENYYYVGPDGVYVTNGWYYANSSRIVQYSSIGQTEAFYDWIYTDANGVLSTDEWEYINGNWYYFDNFYMVTYGSMVINGTYYWFDSNGICLNPDGTGAFRGWTYIGNDWYYFNEDGSLLTGTDKAVINGITYYFDYNGRLASNTLKVDYITHKLIYVNSDGTGKELTSGWHYLQDAWYYVDGDGTYAEGLRSINGAYYYFGNGYMYHGWCYVEDWNGTYFFNESGAWQDTSQNGWYSDGYQWYYVQNNKPLKGVQNINGKTYCLNEYNGGMVTGPDTPFYSGNDGVKFIYGDDGALLYNSWYYDKQENHWYYSNEYGQALKGEHNIGGTTYWFNEHGVWVK